MKAVKPAIQERWEVGISVHQFALGWCPPNTLNSKHNEERWFKRDRGIKLWKTVALEGCIVMNLILVFKNLVQVFPLQHDLMQGSRTYGMWPSPGLWALGQRATKMAGWCMHAWACIPPTCASARGPICARTWVRTGSLVSGGWVWPICTYTLHQCMSHVQTGPLVLHQCAWPCLRAHVCMCANLEAALLRSGL